MATYKVIGKCQNGKYTDSESREAVAHYCSQEYKMPHHIMGSRAVSLDNTAEEMSIVAQVYHNDHQVRLRHSVIGFEQDEVTLTDANQIAQEAVRYFGKEYQIVYYIHEDTNHLHIHMLMNQVSYLNGRKYHGDKKQHHNFVNHMKKAVNPYGISFIPVADD